MSFKFGARSADAAPRRWLDLRMALEILAVLAVDFVLLRIWAPDLVNLHADWALGLAILCLLIALAATGWLVLTIRRAVLISRTVNRRPLPSSIEQENR